MYWRKISYETERILCEATPAELLMEEESRPFGSLACVSENPSRRRTGRIYLTKHPKDEDFIRGKVPMTKETIRRLLIEKLCIGNHTAFAMILVQEQVPYLWKWGSRSVKLQ